MNKFVSGCTLRLAGELVAQLRLKHFHFCDHAKRLIQRTQKFCAKMPWDQIFSECITAALNTLNHVFVLFDGA